MICGLNSFLLYIFLFFFVGACCVYEITISLNYEVNEFLVKNNEQNKKLFQEGKRNCYDIVHCDYVNFFYYFFCIEDLYLFLKKTKYSNSQ